MKIFALRMFLFIMLFYSNSSLTLYIVYGCERYSDVLAVKPVTDAD